MAEFKVSVKLSGVPRSVSQILNAEVIPLLNQAVRAVAQQTRQDWQEAVLRTKLWSGEKDAYAGSITWQMTGAYSAEVSTDYKYAEEIETGRPARDLKRMLDTSQKVRRTKDGRRFLVIPFRHNVSSMPAGVKSMATKMQMSRVVAEGMRPTGEVTHLSPKAGMHAAAHQSPYLSNPATKGATMVAKRMYDWGGRLKRGALKDAGLDAAQAKRYAGMVRMNTSTPGGAKSSAYLTFRIMIEGSSGWVIPAQPGLFIAQKVAAEMQPKAEAAFAEAIKATLKG
jgi:hypothetical protein